jgi:regulator of replication initiation timing
MITLKDNPNIWGKTLRPWGHEIRVDFQDEDNNIYNQCLTFPKEPTETELNSAIENLKIELQTDLNQPIPEPKKTVEELLSEIETVQEEKSALVVEKTALVIENDSLKEQVKPLTPVSEEAKKQEILFSEEITKFIKENPKCTQKDLLAFCAKVAPLLNPEEALKIYLDGKDFDTWRDEAATADVIPGDIKP